MGYGSTGFRRVRAQLRAQMIDQQREAVMNYLNGGSWQLVGEFTEVESGKHSDRAIAP
jgi:hypothetical protein